MTENPEIVQIDWSTWRNGELYIWGHKADDGCIEWKCHWHKGPRVLATFAILQQFNNGESPTIGQTVDIDGYKATVIHISHAYELAFLVRLDQNGKQCDFLNGYHGSVSNVLRTSKTNGLTGTGGEYIDEC